MIVVARILSEVVIVCLYNSLMIVNTTQAKSDNWCENYVATTRVL